MDSILDAPDPESLQPTERPASTPGGVGRRFLAGVLSVLMPGMGQMLLGHIRAAALFLGGFAVAVALFWPLRLPHSYLGLCFSAVALAVLSIASAWHAVRLLDERSQRLSRWWLLLIVPLAYLGSNFDSNLALRFGGFQIFTIPSSAMENTLIIGDHIVVDRRNYASHRPEIGNIVVFRREGIWEVKRIMALGGDTIYGRAGVVYRNGQQLWEPYVIHTVGSGDPFPNTVDFAPVTLSGNQIFVMGDNRDVSYDSRQPEHGPIYLSAESGKPLYIVWSHDRRRVGTSVR